jgi:hypothetical protein
MERRQRILETYLPRVNPVVDPALDAAGTLTFRNPAVEAGVAHAPSRYVAEWALFDNLTGRSEPIAVTESQSPPIQSPSLPTSGYIEVKLRATGGPTAWETPVTMHFRRSGSGWQWVGFERQP